MEKPATTSSHFSSLQQVLQEVEAESNNATSDDQLSVLTLTQPADSSLKTFTLFPTLPAELRFQIWSHAITSLPQRIIPIHEITQKKRVPAYFTSSRPHPLFATINREARAAVFSTLQSLFLPGGNHDFVSVDLEKDTILLCIRNGHLREKTLKRLSRAMGDRRSQELLHFAAEIQIEENFSTNNPWVLNPPYHVIGNLPDMFPKLCHLTFVPTRNVGWEGAESCREELCLGSEEEFDGDVEKYYNWAKKGYERERRSFRVHGNARNRIVWGTERPEVHWGTVQFMGRGKKVKFGKV